MAVTYPLNLPSTAGIMDMAWRMRNIVALSASPFTGQQQALQHPGQWWEVDVSLPPMDRADAESWLAFFASLQGKFGTFYLGDPAGETARGTAGTSPGTPLIKGAAQTGQTINIDGATVSQTGYVLAGDWVQIATDSTRTMHKVLADADSDVSGNVTLELWPNVRSAFADNTAVTFSAATGLFRLASNEQGWSVSDVMNYGMRFTAIEAIT